MSTRLGYSPFSSSLEQDALLNQIVGLSSPEVVGVFDLDGCLFDPRHRQIPIFKEFAAIKSVPEFNHVKVDDFVDWDLEKTMRNAGLEQRLIDSVLEEFKDFWWKRFFHGDYVRFDHAMPGACQLVRDCRAGGMKIVYLTGRHHEQREGTEDALKRFGFPLDGNECRLITKPSIELNDTQYKADALEEIRTMGNPVLFIDNEPSNVNRFHALVPDALIVFIETDYSFLEIQPDPELPRLRSFWRTGWN